MTLPDCVVSLEVTALAIPFFKEMTCSFPSTNCPSALQMMWSCSPLSLWRQCTESWQQHACSPLQVMAPFTPFFTEMMYQNLRRCLPPSAPQSVHWCDFPEAQAAHAGDEHIQQSVDRMQSVIEHVRLIRLGVHAWHT